jgi:outer membrane protein assembly factor BamB
MTRAPSFVAILCLATGLLVVNAQRSPTREWLTWGGDVERTGWSRSETTLSNQNVRRLALKWKAQIDKNVPIEIESGNAMLTTPLVAQGVETARGQRTVVYTLAQSNTLAAIDASNGAILWRRVFDNSVDPASAPNWVCTNTATATPVIDKTKGILYMLAADGRLHGVDLATGEPKLSPPPQFVPPFSRNWSLNLIDGVLYTTVGRGCGNGPVPGAPPVPTAAPGGGGRGGRSGRGPALPPVAAHFVAMDLNNPAHPVTRFFTSAARPSGAWGRAGMVWGHGSLFVQTADGVWDPSRGLWGQSLLRLSPRTLELMDYFTPSNLEMINAKDLDYASSGPVAFTLADRPLVFSGGKDGTLYLHDAKSLGGSDHRTPLFSLRAGNDEENYASTGVWGAPATAVLGKNERWIYVPMWGPPSKQVAFARTNGDAPDGSVMAFQVMLQGDTPVLVPRWVSRNFSVPDPPVVANGVVFAISTGENTLQRHTDPRYHAIYQKPGQPPLPKTGVLTPQERGMNVTNTILYALDAETGEELYSSRNTIDDWTHLSSVTVADGTVYLTTRKSFLYAFGLQK